MGNHFFPILRVFEQISLNKCHTTKSLKVALANGHQVLTTHECDICIDGLPFVLTGHIIPKLLITSIFGIWVLTEAGCEVRLTMINVLFGTMMPLYYFTRR